MKKLAGIVLTAAMVVTVGAGSAFAAYPANNHHESKRTGTVCHYVDEDHDGVCDYDGTDCHYTDADGNGVCDRAGVSCHHADADKGGVCDSCGAAYGGRSRQGHHNGHGNGSLRGCRR